MTSTTATASAPLSRDDAGHLFGQTMGLVARTAGLFALGAYIGRDLSGGWSISLFLLVFAARHDQWLHGCDESLPQRDSPHVHVTSTNGACPGTRHAPEPGPLHTKRSGQ